MIAWLKFHPAITKKKGAAELRNERSYGRSATQGIQNSIHLLIQQRPEPNSETAITPEEYHHISAVMHFFSKVSKLKRQKMIDVKTLNNILGDEITVWLGSRSHFSRRLSQVADKDFRRFIETIKFASIDSV